MHRSTVNATIFKGQNGLRKTMMVLFKDGRQTLDCCMIAGKNHLNR